MNVFLVFQLTPGVPLWSGYSPAVPQPGSVVELYGCVNEDSGTARLCRVVAIEKYTYRPGITHVYLVVAPEV